MISVFHFFPYISSLQRKLTKIKTDNISGSFYLSSIYIMAKKFKKTAIKTEKNEKKFKKSEFYKQRSFTTSLAITRPATDGTKAMLAGV